ncbi:hypothetical protein B0O80DRAFT_469698 [Mortierella sp. GBAus27b]|nr:hypothetical protein BGX31_002820 [Mortierella sp. GBA43]KAI8346134.1 hypothetical protein B0O80DRAFT_469698 [Mortierella sp. GBAus27b]
MIGRSLLSLLVVATVALQSCVATAVEDGNYIISNSNRGLLVDSEIAHVSNLEPEQAWRVENQGSDHVLIQSTKSGLFLAPDDRKSRDSWIVESSEEFVWRLFREEDGAVYIEQPIGSSGNEPLIIGAVASTDAAYIWTQSFEDGDKNQKWTFAPVPSSKRDTQHRCGPWRLESDSLYIQ